MSTNVQRPAGRLVCSYVAPHELCPGRAPQKKPRVLHTCFSVHETPPPPAARVQITTFTKLKRRDKKVNGPPYGLSNIYIIHTPGLGKLAAREGISAQKLLHGTHSAFFCGTSGCSILRALVTTLQKNANCITEPVTSAAASKCACHSGNSRASTSTRCSW